MRYSILLLLSVFTIQLQAQELSKNEVDDFTGTLKKLTKDYTIAEGVGTMNVTVGHIDELYAIYIYSTADIGCAGASGSYIIFLFDDKSKYHLENDLADIDCSDYATSIFVIDPMEFKGKTISKIRFCQGDSYDDCLVSGDYTMNQLIKAVE